MLRLTNCVKLTIFIVAIVSCCLLVRQWVNDPCAVESAENGKNNAKTTVAPTVGSNATSTDAEPPLTGSACRKFMLVMAKRMMKVLTGCTKEVKAQFQDKGAFNEHFQCTIKCFMHKTQMIDENFLLSSKTWETFVTVHLPEYYFKLAREVSKPCLEMYGPKIDTKDPKCIMYGEFLKCLQDIASKQCV